MLSKKADVAAKGAAEAEEASKDDGLNHARRYDGGARSGRSQRISNKTTGGDIKDAFASAVVKELKGTTGRRIVRGIFGGLFKGR
jgi:hypothetical protein